MFGLRKTAKADVLSHWYTLIGHFNISSKEFYEGIGRELTARKIPGLKISFVTFSEIGFFSAKRVYLRMKRERLVFDICAAPFGTSYFFSMRFAELPPGAAWWRWIPFLLGLIGIGYVGQNFRFMTFPFGVWTGLIFLGSFILFLVIVWAEQELSKESYYRQDTRLMYLEVVNAVVKQTIAEFTSAKGINLLDIRQHSPLMNDLYRTTQVNIEPVESLANIPLESVTA